MNAIRRSALEAVHDRLGARWVSDALRWPVSYGDEAVESAAVREAIGLAEEGPLDKMSLTGPIAEQAAAAIAGRPLPPGNVAVTTVEAGIVEIWSVAADEALVIAEPRLVAVRSRLETVGATIVDMSSAFTVLRLGGPGLPPLLEELTPADLRESSFPDGRLTHAPVAGVRGVIGRLRGVVTILVARDEAEYLWGAIVRLGRPHGLVPVGPAAMSARAGAPAVDRRAREPVR